MNMRNPRSMTPEQRDTLRRMYLTGTITAVLRGSDESFTVFLYEHESARGLVLHAAAFKGKALKASFRYRYRGKEHRTRHVREWVREVHDNAKRAADRKKVVRQPHSLEVGDVLKSVWGYEQTNVDYYEVVALNGRTMVTVREIAANAAGDDNMQGASVPVPGRFIGDAKRYRVNGADQSIRIDSGMSARRMEPIGHVQGVPLYASTRYSTYA